MQQIDSNVQKQSIAVSSAMAQQLDQTLLKDQHRFYTEQYLTHSNERGNLYTWGSGEMGQLGYSNEVITKMPKDREGYPF